MRSRRSTVSVKFSSLLAAMPTPVPSTPLRSTWPPRSVTEHEQARAHNGLGRAHHATGDPGQARSHWHAALDLYTELGAPEANHVKAQLGTADVHDGDR